jgi:hypothetical protein
MLGTQDQKVSVTFWVEFALGAEEPLDEQPAARPAAARAQTAALAERGNFIVHSCRGGEGVTLGHRGDAAGEAVVNAPRFVTESIAVKWWFTAAPVSYRSVTIS